MYRMLTDKLTQRQALNIKIESCLEESTEDVVYSYTENPVRYKENNDNMDRVKRIWYLSPMRAAKVQASLRIRAVSPEPSLLAHTSSESRGIFRQKARSLAPLNGWACAVKICNDGMLEDTNSLGGAHMTPPGRVKNALNKMINKLRSPAANTKPTNPTTNVQNEPIQIPDEVDEEVIFPKREPKASSEKQDKIPKL